MGTTRRGLAVSTGSPTAIAAIDDFTDRLAGIRLGVDAVLTAVEREPDVASLQLGTAMLWLYGQTAPTAARAAVALGAAHALEPSMDERERATLAALDRWFAQDLLAAAELLEALVARWPADLLALKALEFLYYVLGQQHMGTRFLATVDAIAGAAGNAQDADFLAVWAFASELSGAPEAAADLAEAALAVEPHTPWAHHALAHVFITRGDPPAAVERLEGFLPVWADSGRVIHAHNAWHLAVALLDQLEVERARTVLHGHIWGVDPDTPGEQIDAVSLLWRLEMAGAWVDDRTWSDVADHVEGLVDTCVFPFLSAHQGFALARADRPAALDALRAAMQRRIDVDDAEARRVWLPVGRPVVDACIAHGEGRMADAAGLLDPVIGGMPAVGGSDAQCDLFRLAYLTALAGSGRTADAERWWSTMTAFKALSPLDELLRSALG